METQSSEMQSLFEKVTMSEGWTKLTPIQQKIIRASLSVSDRAYRERKDKRFMSLDGITSPNTSSKHHIASELCHTAIVALERGKLVTNPHGEESLRFGEHFFDSNYFDLTSKKIECNI